MQWNLLVIDNIEIKLRPKFKHYQLLKKKEFWLSISNAADWSTTKHWHDIATTKQHK